MYAYIIHSEALKFWITKNVAKFLLNNFHGIDIKNFCYTVRTLIHFTGIPAHSMTLHSYLESGCFSLLLLTTMIVSG